jgi:predicted AAA+ superfamily ATPase
LGYELYFWRTRGGSEVDFILYGEREIVAIEVKHSGEVRERDLRGLRAFADEYPGSRLILTYLGPKRERRGEIEVVPTELLLKELPELLRQGADAQA